MAQHAMQLAASLLLLLSVRSSRVYVVPIQKFAEVSTSKQKARAKT